MEKKYIKGSAKAVETKYGEIINLSLNLDELNSCQSESWYIRLSIMKRKEADQWGNTHYIVENTFKPQNDAWEKKTELKPVDMKAQFINDDDNDEELPF